MDPSGGGATPLDLLFDSDSTAALDCFVDISMLQTNLKVNPIGLERGRNLLSNKNGITQFGVRIKNCGVLSQVCLYSPNLNSERERLELYLLLAQK